MKLLIDTNVILDVLCNRTDFVEASSIIWKRCEVGVYEGYISALTVPNIVYILRKELNPDSVRNIIEQIFLIFSVIDLKSNHLREAAKIGMRDYEDALQIVCAADIHADAIVTRNIRDFSNCAIPAILPSELI